MDDQRRPYRYSLKRLYDWFNQLDDKVGEVQEQMGDIPPHSHKMSEVRGLADALKGEQDLNIAVDWEDVQKKPDELVSEATLARISALEASKRDADQGIPFSDLVDTPEAFNPAPHGHDMSDVEGLETALGRKREVTDYPTVEEVVGLGEAMAAKANRQHGHSIDDVSGLATALDSKAAAKHGHAIADVDGLQAALDSKASSKHNHAIADTSGLQVALDGKAAAKHGHLMAEVEGLQEALGKAIIDVQVSGTNLTFVRANGTVAKTVKIGGLIGL